MYFINSCTQNINYTYFTYFINVVNIKPPAHYQLLQKISYNIHKNHCKRINIKENSSITLSITKQARLQFSRSIKLIQARECNCRPLIATLKRNCYLRLSIIISGPSKKKINFDRKRKKVGFFRI